MKLKHNVKNQIEGICGIFQREHGVLFLENEANGKVPIFNYLRGMRMRLANDTATDDTQYFGL